MAKNNSKKPQSAAFPSFSGIDTRARHSPTPSVTDLVNFRLGAHGSLCKREGTRLLAKFSAPIRTLWNGKLADGKEYTFFLVSSLVHRLHEDKTGSTVIGVVHTTSSDAQFCFYRDRLYLIDGIEIYVVDADEVLPIEAYPPLIGKDWPTSEIGVPYEPINLLTRRVRIRYVIPAAHTAFLRTLHEVDTIDALFCNGVRVDPLEYYYDATTRSIIYQKLSEGDEILAYLTLRPSDLISHFQVPNACTRMQCIGDTPKTRLLLWNGSRKNTVYPSREVSEEALDSVKHQLPDCAPLYVPAYTESVLGDGRNAVTAFLRHYDRLLIFGESEAFVAYEDVMTSERIAAKTVNPAVGCISTDSCAMTEGFPVTVGTSGIYRWTADTDEYTEANAQSICEPIRSQLSKDFFKSAKVFYSRRDHELWFYTATEGESIWLYSPIHNAWTRFTGITADEIMEINGSICFRRKDALFTFTPEAYEDEDADRVKHEIVAELQSNLLEYGTHAQKQFSALCLHADCDGGRLAITLLGDGLAPLTAHFSGLASHTARKKRLSSGRFRYATLHLTAGGRERQTVYSIVSEVR